jgi:hypothetical protein
VPAHPWHLSLGEWLEAKPFAHGVVLLRYQPEEVVTACMHQLTFWSATTILKVNKGSDVDGSF